VSNETGHYQSEYVLLARDKKYLPREEDVKLPEGQRAYLHWTTPAPPAERIWTDDYSNLVGVLRERVAGLIMLGMFGFVVLFAVVVIFISKNMDEVSPRRL
jgi:hypothetical protein